jgi:cytochrome c556
VIRAALIATLVLVLAGCGGTAKQAAPKRHACPAATRALAKIDRDLADLRAAAKLPTKDRLLGNHAINAATDRFLNDVELAPISNLKRNRLIDHAMATLDGRCEQCFQAFEAARPIPAIRAGDLACPAA